MRPAQVDSQAIPVAGHGAAIREARVAQGTGPPSETDAALFDVRSSGATDSSWASRNLDQFI
jgi:hypothetical protein